MSQVLNNEFRRAPRRFLEDHSLSVPNGSSSGAPFWLSGLGRRVRDAEDEPETRVAPVRGNVLWLKGFGDETTKRPAVCCDVELNDEEYVARFDLKGAEGSFPTYFLPSQEDRITCVELSPDSGIEYFFTAAATGHTVFVTGTPEQPTIYQANAVGTVAEDEGSAPTPAGGRLRDAYIEALFKLANPYEEPLLYKLRKPLPADPEPEPEPASRRRPGRPNKAIDRRRPRASRPVIERIAVVGWLARGRWSFCYQACDPSIPGGKPRVAPLPEAGSLP